MSERRRSLNYSRRIALLLAAAIAVSGSAFAQTLKQDRERADQMLRDIRDVLKRNYYDPSFRGMDVEARFERARAEVRNADSEGMISGIIAQALVDLDDSHTYFIPPPLPAEYDYGWTEQMVGDRCFLVTVKPGSDAEAQGLKPGDEVLGAEGVRLTRKTLWKAQYLLKVLRPRSQVRLTLAGPKGPREILVKAKVTPGKRFAAIEDYLDTLVERQEKKTPSRFHEAGDVLVWKLESFSVEDRLLEEGIKRAQQKGKLVLDLRGNPGGLVDALQRLTGAVFADAQPVMIGQLRLRKKTTALTADRRAANKVFNGTLVVLVDSESGSAAEIFARVVQLRGRGTVMGDRTAGAVMVSNFHPMVQGHQYQFVPYAVSITEGELVLPDGSSLEKTGLTPDEVLLPTGEDLRARRDPVLAKAVATLGGELTAEAAGPLFPEKATAQNDSAAGSKHH